MIRHPVLYLEWAAWAAGLGVTWWLLGKIAFALDAALRERKRRKRARHRLARWRPVPRRRDTGHDLTTVLPAIRRPKGPGSRW